MTHHSEPPWPEGGGGSHDDHHPSSDTTTATIAAANAAFADADVGDHSASTSSEAVAVSAACKVVVTMDATSYRAGDTVTGTVRVECAQAIMGKVRGTRSLRGAPCDTPRSSALPSRRKYSSTEARPTAP